MIEYPDNEFTEVQATGKHFDVSLENVCGASFFLVLDKNDKKHGLHLEWEQAEELRKLLNELFEEIEREFE